MSYSYHRSRHISQNLPQLYNGSNSNPKDNKQSDKLDTKRAGHEDTSWWKP